MTYTTPSAMGAQPQASSPRRPAAPVQAASPAAPQQAMSPSPQQGSEPGAQAPAPVPPAPQSSPAPKASPGTLGCPDCGAPVAPVSKDGVILFYGCTAYRQTGCRGMWGADPESGKPFLKTCSECGKPLVKRRAKKGGRIYVACFNTQGHASGEVLFFDAEGAPEAPKPKPKGEYVCPECQGPLKYFKLKKGRSAGSMCFACFESARHASGKPRFFDDADGVPAFGGEAPKASLS